MYCEFLFYFLVFENFICDTCASPPPLLLCPPTASQIHDLFFFIIINICVCYIKCVIYHVLYNTHICAYTHTHTYIYIHIHTHLYILLSPFECCSYMYVGRDDCLGLPIMRLVPGEIDSLSSAWRDAYLGVEPCEIYPIHILTCQLALSLCGSCLGNNTAKISRV